MYPKSFKFAKVSNLYKKAKEVQKTTINFRVFRLIFVSKVDKKAKTVEKSLVIVGIKLGPSRWLTVIVLDLKTPEASNEND